MLTLQTIWFLLLAVLFIGYAILDGFDLGIGSLHLFTKGEDERRTMVNAVGPFWDGNEVWLLTGGGAIFAAFPEVYATVFSGFYLALMLLLVALISRAVSVEFRNKVESASWKKTWDVVFFLGSLLPAVLLGVAFGNILRGVPVEASKEYTGGLFGLLNPYAILIGLTSLAMFMMHGAIYLTVKTGGALQTKARAWAIRAWQAFVVLYIAATAASVYAAPRLFDRYFAGILPWALVVVAVAAIAYTRLCLARESYMAGFVSSSVSIASLIGIAAVGLFPNLVPSTLDPAYSLTVMNSSNSQLTLTVMLILTLIGVPIMLFYTAYIYRAFRGKVTAEEEGY
jgi:cytochrome d ubiquinol oxidase subunit II